MRPIAIATAIAGIAGATLLPILPFPFLTITKLLWLASLALAWISLLTLAWRTRGLRITLFSLPLLPLIALTLPGRPIDRDALRTSYLHELTSFEGTPYVWGGENRRGIDCSGLPRRALRNALLLQGFHHANGRAFRLALALWWQDTSARTLARNDSHTTTPLPLSGPIPSLNPALIQPGDLAITHSGTHLLVALGGTRWIQADPGEGTVIILDSTTSTNGWLKPPVTLHRWTILSQ